MYQVKDIPPTGVRLPPGLKEILKSAARNEGRSLNSELIKRLEKSLKQDGLLKA
jgi:predicted HicB family RNase H-like nuclease